MIADYQACYCPACMPRRIARTAEVAPVAAAFERGGAASPLERA